MEQPKEKMIRSKKMRDGARGQTCTMRIPGICNHDPETVVFAHSDYFMHGKATGLKGHDIFGADMCSSCHEAYHKNNFDLGLDFMKAMSETLLRRIKQGILVVK